MKSFQGFLLVFICLFSIKITSQDLEPRFLSSVPLKTNYLGIVYGYSSGNILLNSQVIEDLSASLNGIGVVYGRSFKLFNKPGKFDVSVPYSFGELNALVYEVESSVYKKGFGDPTFRVSMIFLGDKPLSAKDFRNREHKKFKLGASFKVKVPLGKYDATKLINLSGNRWGFQVKAAGAYYIKKHIILELHVDSWFFTENNSYYVENSLKQKPLFSTQLHFAYIFNKKMWASASIGQVAFGETLINDVKQENRQEDSRYGLTFSYRVGKGSLKASLTNGLYTATGTDFTSVLVGYVFLWLDKNKKKKF